MKGEGNSYDFSDRLFDSRIGRWFSTDRLESKYPAWSPYNFSMDNPIYLIDPDGMNPTPFYKKLLGHTGYYAWRARDFMRQNPGMPVPDYYMNYGHKYIQRFTKETSKTLSPAGKKWLGEARKNLQVAIEDRLSRKDGANLERNSESFRAFAFDSHVEAYWNDKKAGSTPLYTLETLDLVKIMLTPDAKDLTSADGLRQVGKMLGKFTEYWSKNPDALVDRVKEAWRDKDKIQTLIENKAEKEGVPVEKIKQALEPILILTTKKEEEPKK